MAPLLFYTYRAVGVGVAIDFIRITNLGHVILRSISMENRTDACVFLATLLTKNTPTVTDDDMPFIPWSETIGAGFMVNWEGELELGVDQDLMIIFNDSPGAAVTAGDEIIVYVGFEKVQP